MNRIQIKEFRKKNKLSIRTVAACVGISAPYLCDIENGKRKPSQAMLDSIEEAIKKAASGRIMPMREEHSLMMELLKAADKWAKKNQHSDAIFQDIRRFLK